MNFTLPGVLGSIKFMVDLAKMETKMAHELIPQFLAFLRSQPEHPVDFDYPEKCAMARFGQSLYPNEHVNAGDDTIYPENAPKIPLMRWWSFENYGWWRNEDSTADLPNYAALADRIEAAL